MASPPPLSFGTTSAPAAAPPPLKFAEPAPSTSYTPPPPLAFGAGPVKIKTPFANTIPGIALNTANPVSLVKAAGHVGLSLLQAGGATAAAIAPSVVQLFNPKAHGAPLTPFMQRVLGEEHQESFQEMAGHAAANEPYPAEGLLGSLANPLAKRLAISPFAKKLGLDKAAPFLAVGSMIGDSFLNLGGFGDLAADSKLIEAIARETDAGAIGSMLRRNGVSHEVADKVAPHLAAMKDPKEVADALKVTSAVQHTADTTHTLHPDLIDSARTEDVHPAAAADWEEHYADRYQQLNDDIAKLKEGAKGVAAEREAAPQIKALNDEGAALEREFIEKWQAPRTNGAMRPPAPHVSRPPKTEAPTAGIDVTNMSREDIAAKAADLKAGKQAESFGPNDVVQLKDKATGHTQERIVKSVNPDGSLTAMDRVSGIPYKVEPSKWDVSLVQKGDATAAPPKTGITFGELAAREEHVAQKTPQIEERMRRFIDSGRTADDFLTVSQHDSGDGPALFGNAREATDYVSSVLGRQVDAREAGIYMREQFDRLSKEGGKAQETGSLPPEGSGTGRPVMDTSVVKEGTGTHSEPSQRQPLSTPEASGSIRKIDSSYSKNSTLDSPAAIHDYATRRIQKSQAALGDFAAKLKAVAPDAEAQVKEAESLISKIETDLKNGIDPEKIPDVLRGRIITAADTVEATYRSVGEQFDVFFTRDFFNEPNPKTGYKALHIIVDIEPGLRAEIQIHTPESVAANKETRPIFEKWRRLVTAEITPEQRAAMDEANAASRAIYDKVPTVNTGYVPKPKSPTITRPADSGRIAQEPVAAPPDDPVIATSEDDSLALSARQHEEWQYALRGDPEQETARNLESIFADLEGVSLDDLGKTLSREDLENAKTEVQIGEEVLLDHPGRALMKYVSRQTGDLPEMGKTTANKNRSRSKFAREGDTLVQNLVGQEASHGGDLVRSQELVDEYRSIKSRVDAAKATFTRIRKTIAAQKKAGTFVENAKRTLAREVARDTEALRNLLKSAERAGYERGKAEGAAKGEKMVAQMTDRLKQRRERIERLQQQYRLPDRKMRQIMGRADPRFMKADAFESWYTKLAEGAARARTSLDRYGALPSAGEDLMGVGGVTGDGEWQGLIRNWYQNQGTKQKVLITDYLGTPEYVLERLGMGETAEKLHDAQDAYIKTRDLELKQVTDWRTKAGKRPEASTRIFRWLDGQERFVAPEMSPEELAVAHDIRAFLKDYADRLDLPEDNRIAKYITHLFEPGPHDKGANMFDDPDLARIMAEKPAGTVYDPFLEQRLGKKGYKEDTWGALDAYVKRASRKEAFDPVLNEMVEKAKGLDESAYNYVARLSHGINMRPTETDKLIDNLITHGLKVTRYTERPTAYISNKLRQGFYRGTIGLNFASALRNLSQGANTYAKLGEKYTTIGYSKVAWRLAKGDLSELYDSGVLNDDYIQDRKVGVYKTMLQRLDPALYFVFETAEKINRGAAFYGAKAKAAARGLSEEEATKYAKRIVRETQFAFTRVDTPVALNNDIGKTVFQLQTYNLKQLEFLGRMARNHEWAGLVRFTGATLAFVYSIGKLFGMQLNQVIPSVSLTGSPFGSGLSALYHLASGQTTNPLDQAKQERNLRNLLLSRVPGGIQLQKSISGLEVVDAGKDVTKTGRTRYTVPQDFGHYLQAGLFGKSSLAEAQAYYESLNSNATTPAYQTPPPL